MNMLLDINQAEPLPKLRFGDDRDSAFGSIAVRVASC